jgi:hypothetical protein
LQEKEQEKDEARNTFSGSLAKRQDIISSKSIGMGRLEVRDDEGKNG